MFKLYNTNFNKRWKRIKKGDILVFLPGQEDIEDLQELLNSRKEILKNKFPEKNIFFKVLPLFVLINAL